MQMNLEIVVLVVLLLAAALIFATLMTDWGTKIGEWADAAISPLRDLILGKG